MLSFLSDPDSTAPKPNSTGTLLISILETRVSHLYDDNHHYRTAWDIILSCVVTVFACAWMAIHPNSSYPNANGKQHLKTWKERLYTIRLPYERVLIFVLLIIFPEFVLAWAIKQCLVAKSFAKKSGTSKFIQVYS